MEDENVVLSYILDLSGNKDAKGDSNSDDNKPLSQKLHKKSSSYSTKASIGTIKTLGTRSSTRNLIREALKRRNKNNKKRRQPKKLGIDLNEPDDEKIVDVNDSNEDIESLFNKSGDSEGSDFNSMF